MKFKRPKALNGTPITFNEKTITAFECCDCGLCHLVIIDKLRKGRGRLYLYRDDHETARVIAKRKRK